MLRIRTNTVALTIKDVKAPACMPTTGIKVGEAVLEHPNAGGAIMLCLWLGCDLPSHDAKSTKH